VRTKAASKRIAASFVAKRVFASPKPRARPPNRTDVAPPAPSQGTRALREAGHAAFEAPDQVRLRLQGQAH
jgi:hypothetical protein